MEGSRRHGGAGASGFLLKDAPADQFASAIRVVAAGESLLAPPITRRLIEELVSTRRHPGELPAELDELTARELEVLKLIARGLSNSEIAEQVVVEQTTVKTHVARVLRSSASGIAFRRSSSPTSGAS